MDETTIVSIYALLDPRDQAVRYVGMTTMSFNARLSCHCCDGRRQTHHRANWIRQLLNIGLRPSIVLLEKCGRDNWQSLERYWIARFKSSGARLTNGTNGGEDQKEFTPEVRAKISAAAKGRRGYWTGKKRDAETIAALVAANKGKSGTFKGKRHTQETKDKISAAKTGKHPRGHILTAETRDKIRAARIGTKSSAETRAKLSAARTGKPHLNHKLSLEGRAKIIAAHKGKPGTFIGHKHTPEAIAKMRGPRRKSSAQVPL